KMLQFMTGERPTLPSMNELWSRIENEPAFGNLMKDALQEQQRRKFNLIRTVLQRNVASGKGTDDVIKALKGTALANYRDGAFATGRTAAERLLRTLVNHATSVVANALFGGNDDNFDGVQWVATLDTRTCIECMA